MGGDLQDSNVVIEVCTAADVRLALVMAGELIDLAQLTVQQHAVLREFVCEPNDRRIARRLDLSPQTVRNHLLRIQKKLKVSGRAELMKAAIAAFLQQGRS